VPTNPEDNQLYLGVLGTNVKIIWDRCRLYIVEVVDRGWTKLVVSCVYPVEKNLIVRTRSEKVDRIRTIILELLMVQGVGLVDRGIRKKITFIPDIVVRECCDCKEHFPLCPTEELQVDYVLTRAFSATHPAQ
jgi:bidirectional [NiFe] hydrogenase diaphorase subunit